MEQLKDCIVEEEDFFNSSKTRNKDNTDEDDYNCAGYALNTFSWYTPYYCNSGDEEMEIEELLMDGWTREEIYDYKLNQYVTRMLEDFPKLRVLTSPTDVREGERLIYFRMFYELICSSLEELENSTDEYNGEEVHTDFHYRYFEDGHWYEKCGSSELRICDGEMDGDWVCGFNCYDSRTIYLALEV